MPEWVKVMYGRVRAMVESHKTESAILLVVGYFLGRIF